MLKISATSNLQLMRSEYRSVPRTSNIALLESRAFHGTIQRSLSCLSWVSDHELGRSIPVSSKCSVMANVTNDCVIIINDSIHLSQCFGSHGDFTRDSKFELPIREARIWADFGFGGNEAFPAVAGRPSFGGLKIAGFGGSKSGPPRSIWEARSVCPIAY
jgi:hypothetical protein